MIRSLSFIIAIAVSPTLLAEQPGEIPPETGAASVEYQSESAHADASRGEAFATQRSEELREVVDQVLEEADIRAERTLSAHESIRFGMFEDEPPVELQVDAEDDMGDDATGTDPRGFGNKLMPYYRYAKGKNELEVQQFVLFGMIGFSPSFGMTYEWALAKYINYSDLLDTGIPPGGGPPFPPGGVPPSQLGTSGKDVGMGDLNLRFLFKPKFLSGSWGWEDELNPNKGWSIMPLIETTLPTATSDSLGSGSWIISPGFAFVTDIPGGAPFGLGFIAMMNFFDVDVFKQDGRESTSRYRGRWFWMQPLTKPGPEIFDGLYVLTEMQPIYDFENDHFSLWIGPEFGKIVTDGLIVYAKPGWGINPDKEDRKFTFEVGVRYFF